jgi:hypothetical protein
MTTLGFCCLGYVAVIYQSLHLLMSQGFRISRPNYIERDPYSSNARQAWRGANNKRHRTGNEIGLCEPGTVPSLPGHYEVRHMCFLPAHISGSRQQSDYQEHDGVHCYFHTWLITRYLLPVQANFWYDVERSHLVFHVLLITFE